MDCWMAEFRKTTTIYFQGFPMGSYVAMQCPSVIYDSQWLSAVANGIGKDEMSIISQRGFAKSDKEIRWR